MGIKERAEKFSGPYEKESARDTCKKLFRFWASEHGQDEACQFVRDCLKNNPQDSIFADTGLNLKSLLDDYRNFILTGRAKEIASYRKSLE